MPERGETTVSTYTDDRGTSYFVERDGDGWEFASSGQGCIGVSLPSGAWVQGAAYLDLDKSGARTNNVTFWPRPTDLA
jgi:hypothetical protein